MLRIIEDILKKSGKLAIVSIIDVDGSVPASAGQDMIVDENGKIYGTVGGGNSEFFLKNKALEMMKNGEKTRLLNLDMEKLGMVCGGNMVATIKVIGNNDKLVIFGGGHISKFLAKFATDIGMNVSVVEDRESFRESFLNCNYILSKPDSYEEKVIIDDNSYVVIVTRGHEMDYEALDYSLGKNPRYLGMIGSKNKVKEVFEKIKKTNIEFEKLDRVFAPIGLDIASEKPEEIAISILSEILLIKNKGSLSHMRDVKK